MSISNFLPAGLLISDGQVWSMNRRFALRVLKDFGFGKSTIADLVLNEIQHLINYFKLQSGQPFKLDYFLNISSLNSIFQLVIGRLIEKNQT